MGCGVQAEKIGLATPRLWQETVGRVSVSVNVMSVFEVGVNVCVNECGVERWMVGNEREHENCGVCVSQVNGNEFGE